MTSEHKMSLTPLTVGFRKLEPHAILPKRPNHGDVGYDLSSAYEYIVKPHGKALINTQLQVTLPEGTYGRVAGRSGLAWKSFITVAGGIIDPSYKGALCVILYNHGSDEFVVKPGDRIAQLILEQCLVVDVVEMTGADSQSTAAETKVLDRPGFPPTLV